VRKMITEGTTLQRLVKTNIKTGDEINKKTGRGGRHGQQKGRQKLKRRALSIRRTSANSKQGPR